MDLIEELYDERQVLINRVRFRVGSPVDAEDIVQEAFARALKYIGSWNPDYKPLAAWFNTIMNNACKDFQREERVKGMGMMHDYESRLLDDEMADSELVEKIIKDMGVTSQSEVLRMYFLLGYTPREIAQVHELKPQSISNIIQRFKLDMREKYGKVLRR